MPFTADEIAALRDLTRLWTAERIVVVGAAALRCFLNLSWRTTQDLDLSVASTIEDATSALDGLPGWSRDPRLEHRWWTRAGIAVDVVPADPQARARGYMDWPRSGLRMSLVGMRLAFERGTALRAAEDLEVRVASLDVLALLKIVAYLDRPDAREKDLGDLAHIMHRYPAMDPDRRYSAEVPDDVTEFDDVGPFLLGKDIAALANATERRWVRDFVATIEDEARGPRVLQRLATGGPVAWRDPDTVLQRLLVFRRGLGEH
jgi:predicted nucleotidyltransferase